MTDVVQVPRWQRAVCDVQVLERDADGRAAVVEYEIDARIRKVCYRLRQTYEPPGVVRSEYLGGDFLGFAGEWRFTALGGSRMRASSICTLIPGAWSGPCAR